MAKGKLRYDKAAKKLFDAGIEAQLQVTTPADCEQTPPLEAEEET